MKVTDKMNKNVKFFQVYSFSFGRELNPSHYHIKVMNATNTRHVVKESKHLSISMVVNGFFEYIMLCKRVGYLCSLCDC